MNFINMNFLYITMLGMPGWKWLSLLAVVICLYFFRKLVLWALVKLKKVKLKKTQSYFPEKTFMQFFFAQEIEKGLSWILISIAGLIALETLELSANLDKYLVIGIKIFLSGNVIRLCYLAAEALGLSIQEWGKTTETELNNQLAPFASKALKATVVVIGTLIVLQNLGVNVTALLAGLGIGGVALAFAAQDTVANIFGTITILLDSPFKRGDHIKIAETEGFVENIGFRSTQIRTLYNSLVTLPNSVVAKEKIDNLSKRNGWIRFRHVIGFTYDANPKLIQSFLENLKYQLLQDPGVDRERIAVNFNSFGDSSMNVLVNFHYSVTEAEDELSKANEYLNLIHEISEQQKLSFAFPTRTLIMQNKV